MLHLPGDEMKGRIIGREGRAHPGVRVDDGGQPDHRRHPGGGAAVLLRPGAPEIARLTLEKLVLDGRIHPQRIEEAYERSRSEVQDLCVRAGEDALVELASPRCIRSSSPCSAGAATTAPPTARTARQHLA